jgi:antitoxin component YwqK of YwqJK toxin-antitoxin module
MISLMFLVVFSATAFAEGLNITARVSPTETGREIVYYLGEEEIDRESMGSEGEIFEKAEKIFSVRKLDGEISLYNEKGILELIEIFEKGEVSYTKEFFENGNIKSEWTWKDGLLDGFCRTYWKNGQVASLDTYRKGRLMKRIVWDETGRMKFEKDYNSSNN